MEGKSGGGLHERLPSFIAETMTKADILIIASIISIAAICYAAFNYFGRDGGHNAIIYLGGEVYEKVSAADGIREIIISTPHGSSTVTFYPDGFAVTAADCPALDCVRSGKASKYYQSIVCLPNRLLIRFETDRQGGLELDALTK